MFNKKEYDMKYYIKNKEKHSKRMKQWQEENPDYNKKWWKKNPDYHKEYNNKYYKNNKEKWLDYRKPECQKQYRENHREEMNEYQKEYYIKNKEKILERNNKWRKSNLNYKKKYRENNLEKIKENYNKWQKDRRRVDSKYNLNRRMGTSISLSLKGNKNGRHWEDLVRYTTENLIKRLKETIPKGYSWKDYLSGKLHIDHILPIRLFQFKIPEDEEFKQCWSLYNLRLLPKKENLLKNSDINNPIILGLLLKEMS